MHIGILQQMRNSTLCLPHTVQCHRTGCINHEDVKCTGLVPELLDPDILFVDNKCRFNRSILLFSFLLAAFLPGCS